jgi:hypothetical protein
MLCITHHHDATHGMEIPNSKSIPRICIVTLLFFLPDSSHAFSVPNTQQQQQQQQQPLDNGVKAMKGVEVA